MIIGQAAQGATRTFIYEGPPQDLTQIGFTFYGEFKAESV